MSEKPWYHNGLRFRCTGCGDCCTGDPGFVWVNGEEIKALAASTGLSVDEFKARYTRRIGTRTSLVELDNGDCIFFDSQSRQCEVYDCRPRQCGTWPFWDSNLATPADWEQTAEGCPGIGQGARVSRQKIEAQSRKIHV